MSKKVNENISTLSAGSDSECPSASAMTGNGKTMPVSHPSMWSISYIQILEFDELASKIFGSEYPQKTMHDVSEFIIKRICQQTGKSYALHLNPNGLKVGAFITHSWDEPFSEFVQSIKQVFQTHATKPNLWICSFALMQGSVQEVKCQLGLQDDPLQDAPFVKALQFASCYVVVRNSKTDVYSRIWCVCELMYARKLRLVPNETYVTGPDAFANSHTSCLDAKATKPGDKARVLKELLAKFKFDQVDKFIRQFRTQEAPVPLITWSQLCAPQGTPTPSVRESDVSDSDSSSSEFTYVSISLALGQKWEENYDWNQAIAGSKVAINEHLHDIYKHSKSNQTERPQSLEIENTKNLKFGFFETNRVVAKLNFDVDLGEDLTAQDRNKIKDACFRLGQILRDAGANDDLLDRIVANGLWKGSMYILLHAPPEAFGLLLRLLQKCNAGEELFDLGYNENEPVRIVSLAPLFLVETSSNEFVPQLNSQLKKVIFCDNIDRTLCDKTDVILLKADTITYFVPSSHHIWNEILLFNSRIFGRGVSKQILEIKTKTVSFDALISKQDAISWEVSTSHGTDPEDFCWIESSETSDNLYDSVPSQKQASPECKGDGCRSGYTEPTQPDDSTYAASYATPSVTSLVRIKELSQYNECDFSSGYSDPSGSTNTTFSAMERAFLKKNELYRYKGPDGLFDDIGRPEKDKVTNVIIEQAVKLIGDYAFSGFVSLSTIQIPNSVTSIGDYAFSGCSSLASVEISSSVTTIGHSAFFGCSSLVTVQIPSSVTSIGNDVFCGCSSLASAEFSSSARSIGSFAFCGCSSLASIKIPKSVRLISEEAFSGCSSLSSVEIPNSVNLIRDGAFYGCSSLTYVKIPSSITWIGKRVFSHCSSLEGIGLPNTVILLGDGTFSDCSSLAAIKIPTSITSVGISMFYHCLSLAYVEIPISVTSIADYAFRGCLSLTAIQIPDSVRSIGKYAFYNCSSLVSIKIPRSVVSIGKNAFSGCSSLKAIKIPRSVTSIGEDAFYGCSSAVIIWT